MRATLVAALLAVSLLLGFASAYTLVEQSGYCARALSTKTHLSGYGKTITGAKGCSDTQSLEVLSFGFSSLLIPHFRLLGFSSKNDTETVTTAAAAADLLFDSVVEYEETNDIPGYQPLRYDGTTWIPGDKVTKRTFLGTLIPSTKWTKIKTTQVTLDDNTSSMYNLSFSDKTISWLDMRYDVEVTSKELRDGRRSLRPNTFKLNLDVTNIKYSSSKSSGIAFGLIFANRGLVVKRNVTRGLRDGDSDEDTVDVMNENGEREIYFSWNRTVVVDGDRPVEVKTSEWSVEATSPEGYEDQASFSFHRLWYSIDERPSSVLWDPTVGSPEAPDNSAGRVAISLFSILVVLFATFMSI